MRFPRKAMLRKAVLLLLVLAVVPVPAAWAQFGGSNQGGQVGFLDGLTNPKAAGKSLVGTLDVNVVEAGYFAIGDSCKDTSPITQPNVPKYGYNYNFRVVQGNNVWAFSHSDTGFCAGDLDYVATSFLDFVNVTVVPTLYGSGTAVFRSYRYVADSGPGTDGYGDNREWFMMDMEFAVK